jgi:lysophospholipase L1-like esterase
MNRISRTVTVTAVAGALAFTGTVAAAQAMPAGPSGSLVAYGHSWPAGYGVAEGYPQMVAEDLHRRYVDHTRNGDLTAGTAARAQLQPPHPGDVVILETGLNDARAYGRRGVAAYRDFLYGTLLALRPAQRVILVLDEKVPAWHEYRPYNHGSPAVVRAYDDAARNAGASFPNVLIIGPQLRAHHDFQRDGVHPNPSGHRTLARDVEQVLL